MGLVLEWKSFKDGSNHSIYNMDEVGMDSTKHQTKVRSLMAR
jgi:hypothetical protein